MPIKPENRGRYPADWKQIRAAIMKRAGDRCECRGECGMHVKDLNSLRCSAPHGKYVLRSQKEPSTYRVVEGADICGPKLKGWRNAIQIVLTIAHLDHTPEHCEPDNLRAYCQRCHLAYDREHHASERRKTRDAKTGQLGLEL